MSAVFLSTPALADRMAEAGRLLAWGSQVDVETMDRLARKVARGASQALLRHALLATANDDGECQ